MTRAKRPPHMTPSELADWIEGRVVLDPVGGCWIWPGARNNYGYAQMRVEGRTVYVHVWLYEHRVGPVPAGTELDHYACDRGPDGCVNYQHVRPATHRENMLRGNTVGGRNLAKNACVRGHDFTPENTYTRQDGERECRTCLRLRDQHRTPRRRNG